MLSAFEILAEPRGWDEVAYGCSRYDGSDGCFFTFCNRQVGNTEITKLQYGKNGAVSLTYNDGSVI